MIRWKHVIVGLAIMLAGFSGCKQQCFLYECDHDHYIRDLGLPERVECDPISTMEPVIPNVATPTTIIDPERPPRYLSLAEAVAIALEQGKVVTQVLPSFFPGSTVGIPGASFGVQDTLLSSVPGPTAPRGISSSIRVLRLDPASR